MTYSSGCHFFLNVNRMRVPSNSYFFARMNRIGSVVKLKFYIRVQEEDIRVQEEFVPFFLHPKNILDYLH